MRPKIVHQADGWNVASPANIAVRIVASSRREGRREIDDQRMSVLLCSFGLCHLKVVHGFESYFVARRPGLAVVLQTLRFSVSPTCSGLRDWRLD